MYELYKINAWISAYRAKFWDEWREKYQIDALICPVYPLVACPKKEILSMTGLLEVLHHDPIVSYHGPVCIAKSFKHKPNRNYAKLSRTVCLTNGG